jgi:uracil-DNA glycosylase
MIQCERCKQYNLIFESNFKPVDFIDGKKNTSKVWIVGLNPKLTPNEKDERFEEDLEKFQCKTRPYFKDFNKVSSKLYGLMGEEYGVSHVDIVKCYTSSFPPKGLKKNEVTAIIKNCSKYFKEQLALWKPELIICNGSPVCQLVKDVIKPPKIPETSYIGEFEGSRIYVVLSGFIGRIDDYSKRRLGIEIEHYLQLINL